MAASRASTVTAGAASLFARNPEWQFMFDTDKDMAVATRKKVYDMAAAERMLVQGYHFPFPWNTRGSMFREYRESARSVL